MAHTTFHGKKGRFSNASGAHTVTKNGERFKVVRQHRRIKPKSPGKTSVKQSKQKMTKETLGRMVVSRGKGVLFAHLGKEFVTLKELLGG